ncbi:peptidylprolyl isomerase [Kaistia algarum]|uniref:peptidylprolyl isomerase n=1 Tax=Kaistia algarum TaxID=2083279 RepID=UPI000CE863F3|nr:peptidylprolyl isomerase [Kaistia algarum]MCX5514481.1 peptidylprolyl isomerase [Kaistia algarum]PPE79264.1 peptidylprolyl isomerase [Kaistia algarum]
MTSRHSPRRLALRGSALALFGLIALAAPAHADDAAPAATTAPAAAAAPAPAPIDPKTVVATINGEPITEGDLGLAAQAFGEQIAKVPPEDQRRAVLDVLIDLKLMATAATAAGLDKSDTFQSQLALLRAQALRSEYFRAEIEGKTTDEAVKQRYEQEIAKVTPQEEVQAAHILVKTEDEAKAIIKELDAGADFATIAKAKSQDPGSAKMGGDLGYFTQGKMVPEFEKAAFALEVGKYTETPVKTQYGFHIIKVTDKRKQPLPSYDQVKDQVRQMVLRDLFVQTVANLRKDNKVDIIDPALKAQPATQPAQ